MILEKACLINLATSMSAQTKEELVKGAIYV